MHLLKKVRRYVADDRWVRAYVNHGRWVADCPHCMSGIMLDPPTTPPGLCLGCRHQYPVMWPMEHQMIEAVLARRPDPTTRNWYPSETVDTLLAENARRL